MPVLDCYFIQSILSCEIQGKVTVGFNILSKIAPSLMNGSSVSFQCDENISCSKNRCTVSSNMLIALQLGTEGDCSVFSEIMPDLSVRYINLPFP